MRHFPLRELGYATGFIALLTAIYAGAYYATVQPRFEAHSFEDWTLAEDGWTLEGKAEYRFAQDTSEFVFQPMNQLDRKIRPEYWSIRADYP